METNRKATKTVIRNGGIRKKETAKGPKQQVAKPIVGIISEPIVGIMPGIIVDEISPRRDGIFGSIGSPTWKSFISKEYHSLLDDIPIHRVNDIGYIHFHIFSVWFLSNMNIPVPFDIDLIYDLHFKHFPFYSSLFHIHNNLSC
jgi:hypothetical protein